MNGWKTNTGAVIAALSQLLVALNVVSPDMGDTITTVGGALATIGIGHKLERLIGK